MTPQRAFAVYLAVGLTLGQLAMGQQKLKFNETCARDQAIATFQRGVKASGGTIDSVHLKGGMAVVVTAKTPSGIKAVQDAAEKYAAARFASDKLEEHCRAMQNAIAQEKISLESQNTATGVRLVFLTQDPALVPTIQGDCCKWCVCPAGTHTGCARCC